jgi:hypothetical protein
VPLLSVAVASRAGWIELDSSFGFLDSTPALIGLAAALAVDFVGDKVPAVDHVLHAVGAFVHPVAGAILFAAQSGVAGDLDPAVAAALGAIVSGGIHAERALVRPLSTAGTGGLGNPALSLAEDAGSIGLTVIALVLPVLALLLVIALLVAGVFAWRALRRRRR